MLNLEEGSSVIGFPLQFQDELKGTNRTFYKELRQAKLRVKKTENWTIVRISQIYYGGSGGEFFFGGALSENQNTSGTTNKDNLASQKWVRKSRLGGMTFSKGFIRNADVVNNTFNKTIQGIIDENNQMGFDY
ncbi:MAG: hypothetical protein OXC03_04570 [Flavobacteriaceae bacterium]|nr:hypothetical protein [Flavobacteriaceae bacterium]